LFCSGVDRHEKTYIITNRESSDIKVLGSPKTSAPGLPRHILGIFACLTVSSLVLSQSDIQAKIRLKFSLRWLIIYYRRVHFVESFKMAQHASYRQLFMAIKVVARKLEGPMVIRDLGPKIVAVADTCREKRRLCGTSDLRRTAPNPSPHCSAADNFGSLVHNFSYITPQQRQWE
jgi:hypothetical protein